MIKILFEEFEQQNYISSMMKGEGICKINIDDYEVNVPFSIAINTEDASAKSVKFNNGIQASFQFNFENMYDAEKVLNRLKESNNDALQLFHYWSEELYRFRILHIQKSNFAQTALNLYAIIGTKLKVPNIFDIFNNKVSIEDINSIRDENTKRYFVKATLPKGVLEFPSGQVKVGRSEIDTNLSDLPIMKIAQYGADDHIYVETALMLFDHEDINPKSVKVTINNVKISDKWIGCGTFTYLNSGEKVFVVRVAIPMKNKKIDAKNIKQIFIDFSKTRKI